MELEKKNQKPECRAALKNGRRMKMAAEMGMGQTSASNSRRSIMKDTDTAKDHISEEEEDCVEIERKVKTLQRLVPGGENMEIETLFEETAEYIEELRGQVMVMRSLADLIDSVAKEKRSLGR